MRRRCKQNPHNWIHRKYGVDENILSLISKDTHKRIIKGWKRIGDQLDFLDEKLEHGLSFFEEDIYPHKFDKLRHSFLKGAYDFLNTYAINTRGVGVCFDALIYAFIISVGHDKVAKAAYDISSPQSKHNQSINKLMREEKGTSEAVGYIQNALACFGVSYLLNEKEEEALHLKAHYSIDFDSDKNGSIREVYENIVRIAKDENRWKGIKIEKPLEGWLKLSTQEKLKRLHTAGRLLDELEAEREELLDRKKWEYELMSESKNPISQEIADDIHQEAKNIKDLPLGDNKLEWSKRLWEKVIEPSVLSEIQSGLKELMDNINPLDGNDKHALRKTAGNLVHLSRKIEKVITTQKPKGPITVDEDEFESEYLDESEDAGMIEL